MILDNQPSKTVHEWIRQYTKEGKIDAVSGYVTIGALAFISDELNEKVDRFRFVFGQLSGEDGLPTRTIDLLNEDVTVEAALEIPLLARKAVSFLERADVKVRTLIPDFCHAKLLVHHGTDLPGSYFISGSSNLTDAGLGLRAASNVELNLVGQGTDANFTELKAWFRELWGRKECHEKIKVDGKSVSFKQYLIDQISTFFQTYTPREIYLRILFEMFAGDMEDWDNDRDTSRSLGKLQASVIWERLYEFQRKGVMSLIQRLDKYNGVILADAVGLGKTWSALAVAKYYQNKGRDVTVFCPKKLHHNWNQFRRNRGSCFESDKLHYQIRYHTDLQDERMDKGGVTLADHFQREGPKLFIIDESHHLRNRKSKRYQFFIENLLEINDDVKLLLLSATPINTALTDVRNQFELIVKGDTKGFRESLGINNLQHLFGRCNAAFQGWSAKEGRTIDQLMGQLDDGFIKLSDALVVSRTRKLITKHTEELEFPRKTAPQNLFMQESLIGEYEKVADLIDDLPGTFAAYMPAYYVEPDEEVETMDNERNRDFFLAGMMHTLIVKRLESSWQSFHSTLIRVDEHCKLVRDRIGRFEEKGKEEEALEFDFSGIEEAEDDELTIGKKRKIAIQEIADSGNLKRYKKNLEKDLRKIKTLRGSLAYFQLQIDKERGATYRTKSRDEKLEQLLKIIEEKQQKPNPKVVIFTSFTDTATYLYQQLRNREFSRVAMVAGSHSHVFDSEKEDQKLSNFEPLLQRFAPYTKLFLEKEWPAFERDVDPDLPLHEKYKRWSEWAQEQRPDIASKLDHPIDILIATDCLSEGQNLQDADLVINYDIHWNPVRAIQRMGRIDRLGSNNTVIHAVNFWPTADMDEYLNLQKRIEDRMTQMTLIGAEVDSRFTDNLQPILEGKKIEQQQEAALLRQMALSWDDIEGGDNQFGFDKLSLEAYRQQLFDELQRQNDPSTIPPGMYSGFVSDSLPKDALIGLLGYPRRPAGATAPHTYQYTQLVCIDRDGAELLQNSQDILEFLSEHRDAARSVPDDIEQGEAAELQLWRDALTAWLEGQARRESINEKGEKKVTAGPASTDIVKRLMFGDKKAASQLAGERFEQRFKSDRFDLICWVHVGKGEPV